MLGHEDTRPHRYVVLGCEITRPCYDFLLGHDTTNVYSYLFSATFRKNVIKLNFTSDNITVNNIESTTCD